MPLLKTGLVGAGVFGGYHAGKIAASSRTDFMGVFDPDMARCKMLADKHGVPAFASLDDLLEACDAILVACPAVYHGETVAAALNAGVHVLVEKPLALNAEAADALVATAEEKNLVLQVGHQERLVLAEMGFFSIDEPVLAIEAVREGPPAPDGRAGDVSVIWDLMIHDLDMVAKLMGRAVSATGEGSVKHSDHVDEARAELSFDGARSAVVSASRAAAERNRRMKVVYASGEIEIDFLTRAVVNSTAHQIKADVSAELPDPLGAADEAFFASCLGERETPIPGKEAAEAVRLAESIETSALKKIGA